MVVWGEIGPATLLDRTQLAGHDRQRGTLLSCKPPAALGTLRARNMQGETGRFVGKAAEPHGLGSACLRDCAGLEDSMRSWWPSQHPKSA